MSNNYKLNLCIEKLEGIMKINDAFGRISPLVEYELKFVLDELKDLQRKLQKGED